MVHKLYNQYIHKTYTHMLLYAFYNLTDVKNKIMLLLFTNNS